MFRSNKVVLLSLRCIFLHFSSFFAVGGDGVQQQRPKEDLTINYGILGGQFHFEKAATAGHGDPLARYGCYGQPDRETTYYMATSEGGYQTLTFGQFQHVAHLFPSSCGGGSLIHHETVAVV